MHQVSRVDLGRASGASQNIVKHKVRQQRGLRKTRQRRTKATHRSKIWAGHGDHLSTYMWEHRQLDLSDLPSFFFFFFPPLGAY